MGLKCRPPHLFLFEIISLDEISAKKLKTLESGGEDVTPREKLKAKSTAQTSGNDNRVVEARNALCE